MYSDFPDLPAWSLACAQLMLALAMALAVWRILRGPRVADRVIALDLLGSLIMAQLVLQVFVSGFLSYLDVATAIALVSFMATVALARCIEDRVRIDHDD